VSGRCYPVNILHQESSKDQRVDTAVKIAIRIHLNEPAGDILAFLTGFEECEQATKKCFSKLQELSHKGRAVPPMMIVPLYGAQTPEQQANAFVKTPENCRKIIFATNIAETSLTVANIGYVLDCGLVKQKVYNPDTGMESLLVVPISKVQAIQRTGRAGRTREGKCIRLYTEKFYKE
jgi:ATP-dependent RNA helicase DHX8/PRP22